MHKKKKKRAMKRRRCMRRRHRSSGTDTGRSRACGGVMSPRAVVQGRLRRVSRRDGGGARQDCRVDANATLRGAARGGSTQQERRYKRVAVGSQDVPITKVAHARVLSLYTQATAKAKTLSAAHGHDVATAVDVSRTPHSPSHARSLARSLSQCQHRSRLHHNDVAVPFVAPCCGLTKTLRSPTWS